MFRKWVVSPVVGRNADCGRIWCSDGRRRTAAGEAGTGTCTCQYDTDGDGVCDHVPPQDGTGFQHKNGR